MKRPVFIIVVERDIEFIDPKGHEKEQLKRDPSFQPNRLSQYDNMKMLYRDVYKVRDDDRKQEDDRNYHPEVIKYFSDSDGIIEVPKDCKSDAKYIFEMCRRLNSNTKLDTRNGLDWSDVADDAVDNSVLAPKLQQKVAKKA